jgi:hypothetical protein
MRLTTPDCSLSSLRQINLRTAANQKFKKKLPRAAQTTATNSAYPSLYIAKFPLVGFEVVENLPPIFSDPAALHVALIIECNKNGAVWLFDYLPENPTDPLVMARIVANVGVPGRARSQQLTKLPTLRCSLRGSAKCEDAIERAREVQEKWDKSELKLFARDCRHFVDELLLELM